MNSHFLLIIFILFSALAAAQSRWGIEFKASRFNTSNCGQLMGTTDGYYRIIEENDRTGNSYSIGINYRLNERSILKFHQGLHQNGSLVTLKICSDLLGDCNTYSDFIIVYHYFQLASSYTYRLLNKRFIIPIEVGININIETQKYKQFYQGIKTFNYDYEVSTGIDYRLFPKLIAGLHGLFTRNISEYQDPMVEIGTFKPKQLGVEFSMMYEFGKSLKTLY